MDDIEELSENSYIYHGSEVIHSPKSRIICTACVVDNVTDKKLDLTGTYKSLGQIIKCLHGDLHCVDGPAIIHSNNDYEWYLNGRWYCFPEFVRTTPLSDDEKIELVMKYG